MDYKYLCVIDADDYYKTFVLVLYKPEMEIQHYTLLGGERLADTMPPTMRVHAGSGGFIKPRWETGAWAEGATSAEIAAWETEHPAPETAAAPTEAERLAALESAMLGLMMKGAQVNV